LSKPGIVLPIFSREFWISCVVASGKGSLVEGQLDQLIGMSSLLAAFCSRTFYRSALFSLSSILISPVSSLRGDEWKQPIE
jgi:hypothetical protein